jgi:hypothetical protein
MSAAAIVATVDAETAVDRSFTPAFESACTAADEGGTAPPMLQAGRHARLSVPELVRACQAEAECFYTTARRDDRYTLELFRRAIGEHDDEAWAALLTLYGALVRSWVRSASHGAADEDVDSLAVEAFERLWLAITPERLPSFPTGAAMLKYLQMCAFSAVAAQARARQARCATSLDACPPPPEWVTVDSERAALDRTSGRDLWATIAAVLRDDAERRVAYHSFVLDLRPREIQELDSQRFPTTADVYRHKRNALKRLRRHPAIRRWAG